MPFVRNSRRTLYECVAMKPDLDQLLNQLSRRPVERALSQLEPEVWRRIETRRRVYGIDLVWGWRAALAAVMLSMGALVGGVATAKPVQEVSPFAINSTLAPSTLLEAHS